MTTARLIVPSMREALRSGRLRSANLLAALQEVAPVNRDDWLNELLGLPAFAVDRDLPRGAVPYLPCNVEAIVQCVREAPVTARDVFVDLGAGLGRVAMLVHLLCHARTIGIEIQPHLVSQGRDTLAALSLHGVELRSGDATSDTVAEGTVFFCYASFNGAALQRVLEQVRGVAAQRPITFCAVDFEMHRQPWLQRRPSSRSAQLAIYDSHPR